MTCPCCEKEMELHEGRNECSECGYSEPVRSFQKEVEAILRQYEDPLVHFPDVGRKAASK